MAGSSFELLEGATEGQTQCDHPLPGELAAWAHPVDVHYTCRGLSGWPKLHVQVWGQDGFGRVGIQGYGFCHIPTNPGMHELECPTWVPEVSRTGGASLASPEEGGGWGRGPGGS